MPFSHSLDRLVVTASDRHAVANAGLLLPATLAAHLDIEGAANAVVDLTGRPGHFRPGAKVMTLIHSFLAGGECIDDADVLRCGTTEEVIGHRVLAPSTLGTFLRGFTFGHVRQLDRLSEIALRRAWAAGAGPGDAPMTMDIDSTVTQVHGKAKQGAAYGYTMNRPGKVGDSSSLTGGAMDKPTESKTPRRRPPYPAEVRERSVRLVVDHLADYPSRMAAVRWVAGKMGVHWTTLHHW